MLINDGKVEYNEWILNRIYAKETNKLHNLVQQEINVAYIQCTNST